MQQPYSGLAQVYDYLFSGVDYDAWADYLEQIFQRFALEPIQRILDLACGTGNSTIPWAQRGFHVLGIDISQEMLDGARQKAARENLEIIFSCQDLREMQLEYTADAAVLYQDGLNYMLTEQDLEQALRCTYDAIRPGGLFVFNLNQVEKLPTSSQPETAVLEEDRMMLIWESHFERDNNTWVIKLTAFLRKENELYEKIQEEHRERSYSREELEPIFKRTGWSLKACYKAFTFQEPGLEDRNLFYVLERGE